MHRRAAWFALMLLLPASAAFATDVSLVGVAGGKAIISIDNSAPHVMAAGTEIGAVKVESVAADRATLTIDGRRQTILLGQFYGGSASAGRQTAVLTDNGAGAFIANASINGREVRLIADTGATYVVLDAAEADRLGLAWRTGPLSYAQTANGPAAFHMVQIATIKVGQIVLNNIQAAVAEQAHLGMALLGQSFLNRTEMTRSGSTMTLTKRF